MTVTVLDRALVADDAGGVTGERQERPDPEVPQKARRRTFTAQYKLDVVAEYDEAATSTIVSKSMAGSWPWPARLLQRFRATTSRA